MIVNTRINGAVGAACGDRRFWDGDGVQNLQYQKPKWQGEGLLKSGLRSMSAARPLALWWHQAAFSDGDLFLEARTWPNLS